MKTINFTQEIVEHVIWNMRLRSFLNGEESINEKEAISHRDCNLGKWLYSVCMGKCGNISEVRELESAHTALHKNVREVIRMKNSGDSDSAEVRLRQLREISLQVISLIMSLHEKQRLLIEK